MLFFWNYEFIEKFQNLYEFCYILYNYLFCLEQFTRIIIAFKHGLFKKLFKKN